MAMLLMEASECPCKTSGKLLASYPQFSKTNSTDFSDNLYHTLDAYRWIFHPDNIKMVTLDGTPVSQSVHRFWREIGGTQGLARALQTDIRVRNRPNYHTALKGRTFLSLINASLYN